MRRDVGLALIATLAAAVLWWLVQGTVNTPGGSVMVTVSVPQLSDAAAQGKEIFDANCGTCHGENASGRDGFGPPLVHKIYEPGHHGDAAFQLAVKNGVRAHHWTFGNMPAVEGINSAQVEKIVLYVRELQRGNGIQ
ncbi:cytochrome c [Hoeflea sp. TYP-13]|uniref:cytochrome c n=1 Tax=Hoeflea sp. TYP-13 TaxID=3230023 RepID=UPI0034C64C1B